MIRLVKLVKPNVKCWVDRSTACHQKNSGWWNPTECARQALRTLLCARPAEAAKALCLSGQGSGSRFEHGMP